MNYVLYVFLFIQSIHKHRNICKDVAKTPSRKTSVTYIKSQKGFPRYSGTITTKSMIGSVA
jgi:heme exporter protein D